jgi:hypothetical protein
MAADFPFTRNTLLFPFLKLQDAALQQELTRYGLLGVAPPPFVISSSVFPFVAPTVTNDSGVEVPAEVQNRVDRYDQRCVRIVAENRY